MVFLSDSRGRMGAGLLLACALVVSCGRERPRAPVAFQVQLVSFESSHERVRPGEGLVYALELLGAGSGPCEQDLDVFVHLEDVRRGCRVIVAQDDHAPRPATRGWRPGEVRKEAFRTLAVPLTTRPGTYRLHVGLFDRGAGQARVLDAVVGEVEVRSDAPTLDSWSPPALAPEEAAARSARRREEFRVDAALAGEGWTLQVDATACAWRLRDERTGVLWGSDPRGSALGRVLSMPGPGEREAWARGPGRVERREQTLELSTALVSEDGLPAGEWVTRFVPARGGAALRLEVEARPDAGWEAARVEPLVRALAVVDMDEGALVVPRWLGERESARGSTPRRRAYRENDLSMAFFGALEGGSALYATWEDDTFVLETRAEIEDHPKIGGRRVLDVSLELAGPTAWVEFTPLGPGDELTIARAHRATAQERGHRVTRAAKREREPRLERLAGAAILRAQALDCSGGVQRVRADFDSIARMAEHLSSVCGVDRALVLISGWNRAGYDCQLPDTLPACEPCGGDTALRECAERVQALGFMLGLHDNYQDIYEDSPSYAPGLLNLDPDGEPRRGGTWSGGQAWRVCSRRQIEAAARNVPEMLRRYAPDVGFLDTTLTTRLESCSSPAHPMEPADDRAARFELFRLARGAFGALGLEGAREWAVPHADLFEALLTHRTARAPGSVVLPLFPAVYGDCVSFSTSQAGVLRPDGAAQFLEHLLLAQMPSFLHGGPPEEDPPRAALRPTLVGIHVDEYARLLVGIDWEVLGPVAEDLQVFVHFLHVHAHAFEGIAFQGDFGPTRPTSAWTPGSVVRTVTPWIAIPPERDGVGPWEIRIGVHRDEVSRRLPDLGRGEPGLVVGELRREGGRLVAHPRPFPQAERFLSRGDSGWGADLDPTDRAIANAYRVLSPLARLTQDTPLTEQAFLDEGRTLERTAFGEVEVLANRGPDPVEYQGTLLPRFGFLVRAPTFLAFHALRFGGIDYPGGALFTLRSADGLPLAESRVLDVYHGFGPPTLRLPDRVVEVQGETRIELGG